MESLVLCVAMRCTTMCVCVSLAPSFSHSWLSWHYIHFNETILLTFPMAVLFHISNYIGFNLDQPDMMKWNTRQAHKMSHFYMEGKKRNKKMGINWNYHIWEKKRRKKRTRRDNTTELAHMFEWCFTTVLYALFTFWRVKKNQNKCKCSSTNWRCHSFCWVSVAWVHLKMQQIYYSFAIKSYKALDCLQNERQRKM